MRGESEPQHSSDQYECHYDLDGIILALIEFARIANKRPTMEKSTNPAGFDEKRSGEEAQPTGGFRHPVAVTTDDSFAVQVRAGQLSWTLDEPEAMGGRGTAPDPVTSFLGALCGCLLISLQITARARQVPIASASASAKANEKGFVKTVDVHLTVRSNAPEEKVRVVVERAERGCYIKGLLKDSIEYHLNLTIESA